jgi:hypothetical protein
MVRHCLAAVLIVGLLTAAPAAGQTEFEEVRERALELLGAQLQAERLGAARDSLGAYLERYPGDAVMQYNQACLLALDGHGDRALERLRAALRAGYRDVERLLEDPDLATLHEDPRLQEALDTLAADYRERMEKAQLWLQEAVWSEWRELAPDPILPGPDAGAGELRLRYDVETLMLEITPAPAGANEVLVTVVRPPSLEEFESDRWTEFRADLSAGSAVMVFARDGQAVTREEHADPVAHVAPAPDAPGTWRVPIPWRALHPNRPPVELMLGLNVTLRRSHADPQTPAPQWGLIRDAFVGSVARPARTFVPVSLDPGPDPAPFLAGRLDRYLAVGDTVSVEFGIQGLPAGALDLTMTASAGDQTRRIQDALPGDAGLTYATILADLQHLPRGWVELTATIRGPEGRALNWRDRGYRLAPDWFLSRHARLEELPSAERTIVQYPLFQVLRGQQAMAADRSPAVLAAAASRTDTLLARWDRLGTVLPPAAGVSEAAFSLTEDALQPCHLVLPDLDARQHADVVVVLAELERQVAPLAAQLHAEAAGEGHIHVVLSAPTVAGNPRAGAGTALRALDWCRELFDPAMVRVVGLGSAASSALRAATLRPEAWSELLLFAPVDFDPWVLSSPRATSRMVGMTLGDLPIQLVLPAEARPRAEAVAEALASGLDGLTLQREAAAGLPATDMARRITNWR